MTLFEFGIERNKLIRAKFKRKRRLAAILKRQQLLEEEMEELIEEAKRYRKITEEEELLFKKKTEEKHAREHLIRYIEDHFPPRVLNAGANDVSG